MCVCVNITHQTTTNAKRDTETEREPKEWTENNNESIKTHKVTIDIISDERTPYTHIYTRAHTHKQIQTSKHKQPNNTNTSLNMQTQ